MAASEPLIRSVKNHNYPNPLYRRCKKLSAFFVFPKTPFLAFRFNIWPQNASRGRFVAPPNPLLKLRPRPLLAPKKPLSPSELAFCKTLLRRQGGIFAHFCVCVSGCLLRVAEETIIVGGDPQPPPNTRNCPPAEGSATIASH